MQIDTLLSMLEAYKRYVVNAWKFVSTKQQYGKLYLEMMNNTI
ncbi:hypothetical protein ACO0K0_14235 [Undibacterium sp. SXout11W]